MLDGVLDLPDGARLAFDDVGEGPCVALLHPGLWDRRTWDDQLSSFPAAGFRTVRFDFRGYGRSSRLGGEPYSYVDDLVALLDALGVDQAALVGCSVGAQVAIDATLEHPDRVWALVAVAPGLDGVEPLPEHEAWYDGIEGPIDEAIERGDVGEGMRLLLEHVWSPLGTDDEGGRRILAIAMDNVHTLTMDESASRGLDPPAARRLHEIDVPTLVLKAEHDPPDSRRIGDLIAAGIPGAREMLVEGADHVVNLRVPERFDEVVLGFLGEVRPRD
ncbi:MAG TPA: alpha/beta hydrolase [Actinomycetota bacterium]